MKEIIIPVLSEQEKIEKSRENFLIFTQLKSNVNNDDLLTSKIHLEIIDRKYFSHTTCFSWWFRKS